MIIFNRSRSIRLSSISHQILMNVSPMNCNGVRINQIWNASIHLDHFAVSAFMDLLVMVNLGGAKVSKTAIIFHILYLQRNDFPPPPPFPTLQPETHKANQYGITL